MAAVLAWAYVSALLIWLALRVFWFDAHWTLALINDNTLYLFAPLLLLFPFAFAQHDYVLFCALMLPGAGFVFFYGARFVPKIQANAPAPNNAFSVTSFNMHFENWDRDAFVKTILASDAALVGLQEVSDENRVFIEERLGSTFPFRVYQPISEVHAVALLSRYPLSDIEILSPPMERGLRAAAHLPGGIVNVIVAHLAPPNM